MAATGSRSVPCQSASWKLITHPQSRVKFIIFIYVYFFFIAHFMWQARTERNTRRKEISNHLAVFPFLPFSCCHFFSTTGTASPDSLSDAEPQKEFIIAALYEDRVFPPRPKDEELFSGQRALSDYNYKGAQKNSHQVIKWKKTHSKTHVYKSVVQRNRRLFVSSSTATWKASK